MHIVCRKSFKHYFNSFNVNPPIAPVYLVLLPYFKMRKPNFLEENSLPKVITE